MSGKATKYRPYLLGIAMPSVGVAVLLAVLLIALEAFLPSSGLLAQELSTDDPPVNFRVTGYSDTSVGVAWEVPKNRGITSYVLQRYKHDGTAFVNEPFSSISGETNGGAGHGWSLGRLTPDTQYKYVLKLKDDEDATVIEDSVTVRTKKADGSSTVSDDAALSALSLSGVSIAFSSGSTYYSATVPYTSTQTTVTASTNDAEASYQVRLGGAVDADGVIPLAVGRNNISVRVTAADGVTTRIYSVIVTREGQFSADATLSALSLSGIDFGTFSAATTQYTAQVVNVTETTVTATVNHSGASRVIKLNGAVDADGVIPLAVGSNVITVEVTAEDGSATRTYTVTVTRALSTNASLRVLSLSNVDFGSFVWHTTAYSARVANSVTQTAVTSTPIHSSSSYMIKLGGVVDADGVIPLAVGRNVITVEVTAEDGSTTRTYTVTVIREVVTGELSSDDPPVNFRVTGYSDTSIGVAWEVPKNRGITSYVLQRYKHDGTAFVNEPFSSISGKANGGSGHGWSLGRLTPDTRYKFVLKLKDDLDTSVIEDTVTVRTRTADGSSTVSDDAALSALSLSGISIAFSSGSTYYSATVPYTSTQTTVTATTNDSGASYQVQLGGAVDADGVIPLAVGRNNISVRVTAADGVTTRVYTVIVTREGQFSNDATLSALSLSGIDIGTFSAAATEYTAQVVNVKETTVTATVNHSGASRVIKLNGVVDADGVIPLAVGSNVITVEVTAEDGSATRTYTVTVTRALSTNASLRVLSLSNVDFGAFVWHTTAYSARVANSVTQTAVTSTPVHSSSSYVIKLGGVVDADGVIPLGVGRNVITVEVTAEDGSTTRTYTVTVIREVVTGELSSDDPPVNFRVTGYSDTSIGVAWEVPKNRGITGYVLQRYKHDGTAFVNEPFSSISGKANGGSGHGWSLGRLTPDTRYKYVLKLKDDLDTIVIEDTAAVRTRTADGSSTVSDDAALSALSLSGVSIAFSSGSTYYSATVPYTSTQTTVTATTNDSGASYQVQLGGAVDADGVIPLAVGRNNISVRVTAADGVTTRVYSVIVTREGQFSADATLSALSLSGIDIGTFNAATTQYTAQVVNVTQTTVTATVNHSGASRVIKLNGAVNADGVIPLAVGSNVITVEVTAEDGSATRTYTVTVTRALSTNASLRVLSLSNVDFGSFVWHTTAYSARVANSVTQTAVTSTPVHSSSSYVIKLNGVVDADGVIPLGVGRNVITVEVTAEDGVTTRTYTVTVIREVVTGELSSDDPPVNFRVTGYSDTAVGMAWEVPKNRGITGYVLQRYKHDGTAFVADPYSRISDPTNGGAGHGWSFGRLTPDTRYKFVLKLKDDLDTSVIEDTVTVRTRTADGSSTVSDDAALSALSLSGISIAFSSGSPYYSATVPYTSTQTMVTATTSDSGASYQVQLGGAVDADGVIPLAVGRNNISVRVTAADGVTTRVYTVIVTREGQFSADATLSALSLSGIDIGTFNAAATQYTAQVVNITQTTVTATVNHSGASRVIKLNGAVDADGVIPLAVGSNVITVEVTAEDGSATRTYTVTVTRALSTNASLRVLSLSNVDFGSFVWHTTAYSARVANSVTQTAVTSTPIHSSSSYMIRLGGVVDADGVIPLAVGRNVITVEVTAEDGSTTRTYTVTVIREVVTGELSSDDPPVNFRVTGYSDTAVGMAWEVPRNRGITGYVLQRYKHDGTAFVNEPFSSISGKANGGAGHGWSLGRLTPDTQYKFVLKLKDDLDTTVIEDTVTVRTQTADGSSTVSDDAALSALSLSGISIAFNPGLTHYTATVAETVTETTVTASTNDAEASHQVQLGGVVDADGVIPLAVGRNNISVRVTAADGVTTRIYTVIVTREGQLSADATLSALSLSGIDIGTFNAAATQYTAQVANTTQTTVTATVNHAGASYVIKLNGIVDADGVIPLALGNNVITVEVTAEDGSTIRTYTVTVTREMVTGTMPTDDPPVNFRVTSYTDTSVTVAWGVPKDRGITGYLLQRHKHNGASFVFDSREGGQTGGGAEQNWSNGNLTPDTQYKYLLTLNDGQGTTVIEATATVRTRKKDPLAAPVLTAAAKEKTVELSWAAVARAASYELWTWWDRDIGWQRLDDGGLTGTSYTHSGLAAGTTYYYTIRTVDANDLTSAWSEHASATVSALAAPALPVPTLKAQAGAGQVTLTWDAVAGAVRYELWVWRDEETGWQRLDGGSLTGTTHTHSGLVAGTTYYYTIRAVDASGAASDWSDHASAVAGAAQH